MNITLITTLFSIFAPFITVLSMKSSLVWLLIVSFLVLVTVYTIVSYIINFGLVDLRKLFPSTFGLNRLLLRLFLSLRLLNLVSITLYRYPVTTTLGFNLRAALSCWLAGIFLQVSKATFLSAMLPANSPWYLIPFLCLVEVVRVLVRPITLCFRLLANMTAGHVLLALICKMPYFWPLGSIFGVLELAVAVVQAFVFSILISVYLEEAMSH